MDHNLTGDVESEYLVDSNEYNLIVLVLQFFGVPSHISKNLLLNL